MKATQSATVFTVKDGLAPRLVGKTGRFSGGVVGTVYERVGHVTALLLLIGKMDAQANDVAPSAEMQSCVTSLAKQICTFLQELGEK